jgi:YfiH family protein
LLDPWVHGFFTHHFWLRAPAELTTVLHATAQSYRVKQVHGNTVLTPSEIDAAAIAAEHSGESPSADGLITDSTNQAVWICTADCVPVLITDSRTGQVAAIHAGWRGTAMNIVPRAIARLQSNGSQLQDLRIALGPAISGEKYQVSEQVAVEVGATIAPIVPTQLPEAIAILRQLPDSPLLNDPEPGRVRLDVRRVNALQLEQLGLSAEQIAIAPQCTYQNSDHFFSYRRIQQKKAQWSGIVSTKGR